MKPNVIIKHTLQVTEDLSQFKLLSVNRKVSLTGKRRQALIESMQKFGTLYPVLVVKIDGELFVLDGQHRFEVCKRVGFSMPYLIISGPNDEELSQKEIYNMLEELNVTSQNWSVRTVLSKRSEMFPESSYVFLRDCIKEFPCITPTALARILTGQSGSILDMLAQGIIITSDISHDTLQAINDITELIGEKQRAGGWQTVSKREFINLALIRLMRENQINIEALSLLFRSAGDDFKMLYPLSINSAYDYLLKEYIALSAN